MRRAGIANVVLGAVAALSWQAARLVLVVPVVVAYAFLPRYFIESMAGTGVKG